jgi:hypothetical protein
MNRFTFKNDTCEGLSTPYLDRGKPMTQLQTLETLNMLHEENQRLINEGLQHETIIYALKQKLGDDLLLENQRIKNTIIDAYSNERTDMGRAVLRQLMERLDIHV